MRRRRILMLAAAAAPMSWAAGDGLVEVNTASRAALEALPGLGPSLAQRLLDGRPFRNWSDLMQRVPGVKVAAARRLSAAGLRVAGAEFSPHP